MKLRMRATALGKKITLLTTAFILAVSTLTASVPFILSQNASAVAGTTVSGITTFEAFKDALNDPNVGYINLASKVTITAPEKLVLSRSDVRINGNDSTIVLNTATSSLEGWKSDYVFQAYNVSNVEINSLRVKGGDAGFLINGSQVTLKGNTHVDGHEFGGIEVSRGSSPSLSNSQLTLQGALWSESAPFEAVNKPSVWVVDGQGSVDSTALYQKLTAVSYVAPGKTYLYRNVSVANPVATNLNKQQAYDSIESAIAAASTGDTLQLNKDVTLTQPVQVNKPVTIDGAGKTVTSAFDRTSNLNNAAFVVTANNATLKNLTVTTTSTLTATSGFPTKPHAVVTYNVTGALITNVTLKDNLAGLIVNGSKVTIDGVHTAGNLWYGIDVDKAGAILTVRGTNTHTEAKHIFVDDTWTGAYVIDQFGKYNKEVSGRENTFNLDTSTPVVNSINYADGTEVDGSRINKQLHTVNVSLSDGTKTAVNFTNFTVRKGGVFKAQGSGGSSLNPTFNLDTTNFVDGSDYTLEVYGRDNNGNTFNETVNFTVDGVAPEVLSVDYSTTAQTRNNVLVTVTVDEASNAPQGWVSTNGGTVFTKEVTDNEASTVNFTDFAGNTGSFSYSVENIDRSVIGAIAPISRTTTTPNISGVISYNVDGVGVEGVALDIYVDDVKYSRTTDEQGIWTISGVNLANNTTHRVAVFQAGADPEVDDAFDTEAFTTNVVISQVVTPPIQPTQDSNSLSNQPNGGLPLTTFGAAQVLGTNTGDDTTEGTEAVEGTSTEKNLAAAVDTDSSDGTVLGMAWYWWLLIVAALATLIWWIVGAARNRQAE